MGRKNNKSTASASIHAENNQMDTKSLHKDADGHVKSMLFANRKNKNEPTRREKRRLEQAEKKRSKALHWGKTRGKTDTQFISKINEQTIKGLPKQIQSKINTKKRSREQQSKQLKANKRAKEQESRDVFKNKEDLFSLSNEAVEKSDHFSDESEIESDMDDENDFGSGGPIKLSSDFFGYDSDDSDIIDDISPEIDQLDSDDDEKSKKTGKKENKKKKKSKSGDSDGEYAPEGSAAMILDDKFFKEMEDREMPDNRLIEELEKKLGFNKKKRKQKKEEDDSDLDKELGIDSGKESELQKYVREKREKKKADKSKKKNNKNSDNEEESDEEGDFEEEDSDNDGPRRFNDGLDGLLDNLDEDEGDDFGTFDPDLASDEEDQNDLAGDGNDDVSDFMTGLNSDDEEDDDINDGMDDLDEFDKFEMDSENEQSDEESENEEEEASKATTPIAAAPTGKYIPPHLRQKVAAETSTEKRNDRENDFRYMELKKQIKQILNKVALDNIELCTNQALSLYQKNSKNDFSKLLTDLIIDSICDNVNLQSQFVLVYATFITAIHNIIGDNVGSAFLERVVHKFNEIKSNKLNATNLLIMLCHVYNLGLVYSGFIYGIVRVLCEQFTELNVELVYKLLQTCGFQLRTDDPSSLKDIVDLVQSKAESDTKVKGERIKFLLDMMNDIKNNRRKKEHEDDYNKYKTLRKAMKNMQKKRGSNASEHTLRIPFEDLLNADSKGRWWIVGSAWVGRQASETHESLAKSAPTTLKYTDNLKVALEGISDKKITKLEKLAKEQRMTTEMRKIIFCIIMSGEDYMDAFQRLVKLGVKRNDREIARVLVHCCCQERQFNEYYALLAKQLASLHRSSSLTFQYTFFEQFKLLNTFAVRKVINLSYLLAYLIGNSVLSLTCLKVVDFESLVKQEVIFFRLVFIHLLLDYDEDVISKQCLRLVKVSHCESLRESMQLFLMQFIKREFRRSFVNDLFTVRDVSKKSDKKWLSQNEKLLKKRAKLMKKVLNTDAIDLLQEDDRDEDFGDN